MESETSICNKALLNAGARKQIASLDENSNAARVCKLFYENTRDALLQEAQWTWARKYAGLGLITGLPGAPGISTDGGSTVWSPANPAPGWLYQYGYPADCLRMDWVIPQGQWGLFLAQAQQNGPWQALQNLGVPFEIGTANGVTVVNTNAQQAIGSYTMRVTNVALFPPQFVTALAGRLAKVIVIPLSGDKGLAQGADTIATEIVATAKATDANQGMTIIDNVPDWLKARDWPDDYGGPPGWFLTGTPF